MEIKSLKVLTEGGGVGLYFIHTSTRAKTLVGLYIEISHKYTSGDFIGLKIAKEFLSSLVIFNTRQTAISC